MISNLARAGVAACTAVILAALLAGCGSTPARNAAPAPTRGTAGSTAGSSAPSPPPPSATAGTPIAETPTAAPSLPAGATPPGRTPLPTPTVSPVASPTATGSLTPAATAPVQSPTPAPSPTIAPTITPLPPVTPTMAPTATRTPLPTPAPSPTPRGPLSWLDGETLLTIYGRAYGVAPILGRLGMDNNFADLEWQIQPFARGIKAYNGGKDTRITVHLIYAMAVPCSPGSNCLYYLDDAGVDLVRDYIAPAARRHWLVVLDDQLGRSDPLTEVRRMIAKGYLRYDNVEVALDPEFRAGPNQDTPGIPVGWVTADEINAVQALVNAYCARHHLLHRKVLMVHQFQWGMIENRATLRSDFPYVDPVIIADGFGPPGLKAHIYSELLGPHAPPNVRWRGIKLFYPNPYESAGHGDDPLMDWAQVFGLEKAIDSDGKSYSVRPQPNVIVIA